MVNLTILVYFVPYLYLFAAWIWLRRSEAEGQAERDSDHDARRRHSVWLTAACGFLATLIAIGLVFVPPPDTANVLNYEANLVGQSLLLFVIGFAFYAVARRRRDWTVAVSAVPSSADVVIVGGSVVGSSAAWNLREDGFTGRIVVVERDPSYVCASAFLAMGGIRQQFCTPVTVQMVQYSVGAVETVRRAAWRCPAPRRARGSGSADTCSWPIGAQSAALMQRYEAERRAGAPSSCCRATRFARSSRICFSTTSCLACSGRKTATRRPAKCCWASGRRPRAADVEYVRMRWLASAV